MLDRLIAAVSPPYDLPTRKEVAAVILIMALARGWWDERQHSRELLEIGTRAGTIAEDCRITTGARLKLLTERVEVAEDRSRVLVQWIESVGLRAPAHLMADVGR